MQGFTEFNVSTAWQFNTQYCNSTSSGKLPGGAGRAARLPHTYVFKARFQDVYVGQILRQLSVGEWHVQELRMWNAVMDWAGCACASVGEWGLTLWQCTVVKHW